MARSEHERCSHLQKRRKLRMHASGSAVLINTIHYSEILVKPSWATCTKSVRFCHLDRSGEIWLEISVADRYRFRVEMTYGDHILTVSLFIVFLYENLSFNAVSACDFCDL